MDEKERWERIKESIDNIHNRFVNKSHQEDKGSEEEIRNKINKHKLSLILGSHWYIFGLAIYESIEYIQSSAGISRFYRIGGAWSEERSRRR